MGKRWSSPVSHTPACRATHGGPRPTRGCAWGRPSAVVRRWRWWMRRHPPAPALMPSVGYGPAPVAMDSGPAPLSPVAITSCRRVQGRRCVLAAATASVALVVLSAIVSGVPFGLAVEGLSRWLSGVAAAVVLAGTAAWVVHEVRWLARVWHPTSEEFPRSMGHCGGFLSPLGSNPSTGLVLVDGAHAVNSLVGEIAAGQRTAFALPVPRRVRPLRAGDVVAMYGRLARHERVVLVAPWGSAWTRDLTRVARIDA